MGIFLKGLEMPEKGFARCVLIFADGHVENIEHKKIEDVEAIHVSNDILDELPLILFKNSPWVKSTKLLPKDDRHVLVTDGKQYAVGYYDHDHQTWYTSTYNWINNNVTQLVKVDQVKYWMPLSILPGSGGSKNG